MDNEIYYIGNGIFSVYFISGWVSQVSNSNYYVYNCVQQYIVKKKQELFDPQNIRLADKIMNEVNLKNIERYCKMIKNYDNDIWNKYKYQIMLEALKMKFTQNPIFRNYLMATGKKIIVDKNDPTNLLGRALMEVRGMFRTYI